MQRTTNPIIELVLCVFLGFLGIHRFYTKKIWTGILFLFSFGLFGFGVVVDEVLIIIRLVKWLAASKHADSVPVAVSKPAKPVPTAAPKPAKATPAAAHALWDEWDASVHMAAGQSDRMARAHEQNLSIKKIKKDGTAIIRGSTGITYYTRFDRCTCEDFQHRHLPCKHMYLYAIKHAGFDPGSIYTTK